jgi:hypothetical protein
MKIKVNGIPVDVSPHMQSFLEWTNFRLVASNSFFDWWLRIEGFNMSTIRRPIEFFAQQLAHFLSERTCFSEDILFYHLRKLVSLINLDEESFLLATIIFFRYAKRNSAVFEFKKEIELIYFFSVCSVIGLCCCRDQPFNCVIIYKYFGIESSIFLEDELHVLKLINYNVFFTRKDTEVLESIMSVDMLSLLSFSGEFPELDESDDEESK